MITDEKVMAERLAIQDYEDLMRVMAFAFDPKTEWKLGQLGALEIYKAFSEMLVYQAEGETCRVVLALGKNKTTGRPEGCGVAWLQEPNAAAKKIKITVTILQGMIATANYRLALREGWLAQPAETAKN